MFTVVGPQRSGDVRKKKGLGGFTAGPQDNDEKPDWLASFRAAVAKWHGASGARRTACERRRRRPDS